MTDIHAVAVVLVFKSLQVEGVLVGAANSNHGPYHPTCGKLEFGGNAYKAVFLSRYYLHITSACNSSTLHRLINTRFQRNKSTFIEFKS